MKRLTVFAAVVLFVWLACTSVVTAGQATQPHAPDAGFFGEGHRQDARNIWLPRKKAAPASPALSPGRDEDLLDAARLSRAARGRRAADRVADHHRLRSRRPHVGARAPGVSSRHVRARHPGSRLRCRRSRRRGRRRHDGQAHGVRRSPGTAARAEGPRSWRARRRTAKPLAHEGHRRRSSRPTRRRSSTRTTAGSSAESNTTRMACSGAWTTCCTRQSGTKTCD